MLPLEMDAGIGEDCLCDLGKRCKSGCALVDLLNMKCPYSSPFIIINIWQPLHKLKKVCFHWNIH